VLVGLAAIAAPAEAEQCRGSKKFYQGQCRYPDEISKLKAAAANKAAEAKRRREEAKRQAEEARKAEEEKRRQEELAKQPPPTEPPPTEPPVSTAPPTEPPPTEPPVSTAPPPPVTPDGQPEPPTDGANEGSGISPLVWAGFGVGGAGLVAGAITGAISMAQASSLKDECPNDLCPADKRSDIATMLAIGHVSTASLIVGGVGVIVGVLGLVIPTGEGEPESEARVQPFVGPGTIGVTGAF